MNKSILSTLVLLTCSLSAMSWDPKMSVRHRDGGGVGYSLGYTTVDFSYAANTENAEYLMDLRGHLFNSGHGALNAGLGFRYSLWQDKYLLGINAFYDHRSFAHQIGAGLECLNEYFDVRINGYLPVGAHFDKDQFKGFRGNQAIVSRKVKSTLPCIEGEIGTTVSNPFYVAVGSYYLFHQEHNGLHFQSAVGVKARAMIYIGCNITIGANFTYDHIFHARLEGIFSFNIPFGNWNAPRAEKRNPRNVSIHRNEIIPFKNKRKTKAISMPGSPAALRFIFVDNTAPKAGTGTIEQPFASLKEAEGQSKPGDIIYVFPGDGTPKNMDQGIVLKKDQVLASSSAPLKVENVEIPPFTPGNAPVIINKEKDKPVVKNPGTSRLSDFIFNAPWKYIFGNWDAAPSASDSGGFTDARAEGFHVIESDRPVVSGDANVPIQQDYQRN